jgi:hypothetical protein
MGSTDDALELAKLERVQKAIFNRAGLARYGAYGTAIGQRVRQSANGQRVEGTLCLRVLVKDKPPLGQVPIAQRLGPYETFELPGGPVTVAIDVCKLAPPSLHRVSVAQKALVDAGDSNAPSEGTIGGWAWDNRNQCIVMLSNAHVFGSTPRRMVRVRSVPFGRTGRTAYRRRTAAGRVDAAIADPISEAQFEPDIPGVGPGIFDVGRIRRGDGVVKRGATTGLRTGIVDAIRYDVRAAGIHMEDGIAVLPAEETWTQSGDSGGVLFAAQSSNAEDLPVAVGLHFAGQEELGLAFHIEDVFEALDLSPLKEEPFVSFLNGIFWERKAAPPFEFIRLRRTESPKRTRSVSPGRQLYEYLRASPDAVYLAHLFRSHRVALLSRLVADSALRWQITEAFRPLFSGASVDEALRRPITTASKRHFQDLLSQIALDPAHRDEVEPLRRVVDDADGRPLSAVLRALAGAPRPTPRI